MPKKKTQKNPSAAPANVRMIQGRLAILPGKPAPVISSTTAYTGPLFRVQQEHVHEPHCGTVIRDIIRHGGSVVILAIDDAKRRDPLVVLERQYRHAAGQFLYEVPAAKRELAEETGFRAKKWTQLARYYASPGFLAE